MLMKGPWTVSEVDVFLHGAVIPVRLSVVGRDGAPRVLSLWFLPEDGHLLCATQRQALVVSLLRRDPRCAFEVAGDALPYKGVRGTGRATLHEDLGQPILERLLSRYGFAPESKLARTLMARADQEVAIRVAPERMTSWDFTTRMKG